MTLIRSRLTCKDRLLLVSIVCYVITNVVESMAARAERLDLEGAEMNGLRPGIDNVCDTLDLFRTTITGDVVLLEHLGVASCMVSVMMRRQDAEEVRQFMLLFECV